MTDLAPLETLYDATRGSALPLPALLERLYGGGLIFPRPRPESYIYGNFVSTLDGVVSLNVPGRSGGKEISGFNLHDRMVMGLLRAVADAVVVGAGTLRAVPQHRWTADYVYPDLRDAFDELRVGLGKAGPPLNVIVTASGDLDLSLPVFHTESLPVLVVTTPAGAGRLRAAALPPTMTVRAAEQNGQLDAAAIVAAVSALRPRPDVLLEGGPHLMGDFFAARLLDDLFLTLAPQVAGRVPSVPRPGLVEGHSFAPENPVWGTLTAIKRAESHLFLRYAFPQHAAPPDA